MKKGIWGIWCGIAVLVIILNAQSASANLLMASGFDANDCSGFFGSGFDACQIWDDPANGQTIELSPVIIKFDQDLNVEIEDEGTPDERPAINSLYPTVDGSEFTFTGTGFNNGSGTWTYTPDDVPGGTDPFDPALHDPAIKYWAAKAQNDFILYWVVLDGALEVNGGDCDPADPFTIACLNQAQIQTTNTWSTPLKTTGGSAGDPRDLSHLTFYDSVPARNPDPGPTPIPEPATMLLLGTGLIGVAGAARRRKKKQV